METLHFFLDISVLMEEYLYCPILFQIIMLYWDTFNNSQAIQEKKKLKMNAVIKVTLSALIIIFGQGRCVINKFKGCINLKLKNRKISVSKKIGYLTKLCFATSEFPERVLLEVMLNL